MLLPLLALPAAILTYSRGVLVALVALVLVLARSKRAWPAIAAAAALVVLLAPAAWHDRVADVGRLDRPRSPRASTSGTPRWRCSSGTRFSAWG